MPPPPPRAAHILAARLRCPVLRVSVRDSELVRATYPGQAANAASKYHARQMAGRRARAAPALTPCCRSVRSFYSRRRLCAAYEPRLCPGTDGTGSQTLPHGGWSLEERKAPRTVRCAATMRHFFSERTVVPRRVHGKSARPTHALLRFPSSKGRDKGQTTRGLRHNSVQELGNKVAVSTCTQVSTLTIWVSRCMAFLHSLSLIKNAGMPATS